jgi:hypothetical protein
MNKQSVVFALLVIMHGAALAANGAMTLGFHVHEPINIRQASQAGYGAIRLWDSATGWSSLQSYRGRWNLRRVETYLAESDKANLKVLWVLGNTPRWASARPDEKCAYGLGCAAEPATIQDWRHYVRTIATRYRGRVECYEPWNEVSFPTDPTFSTPPGAGGPAGQFFSGTAEAMVALARVAYEEIKRADPDACVLSPSFHPTARWADKFDRFLALGGGQYADVISQHFYFRDEPEQTVPAIQGIRRVMAKHSVSHLPIWNTEVGVWFGAKLNQWPGLSAEELIYSLTLRSYLLNASQGVQRVYWYAWDNKGMGFSAPGVDTRRAVAAATAAVGFFDGFESAACQSTNSLWQCAVRTGGRRLKVVWLAGKDNAARPMVLERPATRWGSTMKSFPAGTQIMLDARPVIIDDDV